MTYKFRFKAKIFWIKKKAPATAGAFQYLFLFTLLSFDWFNRYVRPVVFLLSKFYDSIYLSM